MRRINEFIWLFLLFVAVLVRCTTDIAGGGSDLPDKNVVTGSIYTTECLPAANTQVVMVPEDYNSLTDAPIPEIAVDTTDSAGTFVFNDCRKGTYAIQGVQLADRTRLLITGVTVGDDTTRVTDDTLRVPGTVKIFFPDSQQSADGRAYIPGTVIASAPAADGYALLDSVPAGTVPGVNFLLANDSVLSAARTSITVPSGDTVVITKPEWRFSSAIVFNTSASGADVAGNVTGFPVLIRLTTENFDFTQAREDGADLRFMKADATQLAYAIEAWDPDAGRAEVWVLVDTMRGNDSLQSIFMYWGNAAASPESDAAAVFDTRIGFQAVWHLSETGNTVSDATENHYDGIAENMNAASEVPGMIGTARKFDGDSTYIHMPGTAGSTLNFPEHGTYSVSAWVNIDSLTGEYRMIASKGDKQYNLQFRGETQNWQFTEYQDTVGWDQTVAGAVAGEWVYLVGVRENDKQYLYLNGVCVDSGIYNHAHFPSDTTYAEQQGYRDTTCDFMIGKKVDFDAWYFNGVIDEVRVEDRATDPDWIRLCYMNQKRNDVLVKFQN